MHIEFLVEEESAEKALRILVPKIFDTDVHFDIHTFQGKRDLLQSLPSRLKGYRSWLPADWRIVVLIDEDRQDCVELKNKLEQAAQSAGFSTRSTPGADGGFQVINRLAVEELEAWFFGDVKAIVSAYPNVSPNIGNKATR